MTPMNQYWEFKKFLRTKHKPKTIQYINFNHFDNVSLWADLVLELTLQNVQPKKFEKSKFVS